MKSILISFIIVCCFAMHVFAQNEQTLITIGDTKISKAEFERIYNKNNNNLYNEADKKTPKEYIDLFVDFKLKVIEAEALKLDTVSTFVNELAGYRKELAAPYLTDVKYNEQMVRNLYDRMAKEVNASHLLLRVEENASEAKVQEVKNRILDIKKEILAGKDFGEAAFEYSEDPSAKTNKGNLNYFTAFQMVVPFEDAAFSTKVGEITDPIRTSFGWHILMVHDIRENRGEILVAHIMLMFPQNVSDEIKAQKKAEIDEIYKELQNGADFAKLAKEKSDDKRSAENGGEMPWFSAGRMIKEFSDPAFALKDTGEYTAPIETAYGYHIIKKLDHRGIASFDEMKTDIENRIKRDPARSITSKTVFIDKLKAEYNFSENSDGIAQLKSKKIEDNVSLPNFDLFVLDGKSYAFDELQNFIQKNEIKSGMYTAKFDLWVEDVITDLEDSKLEEKYPDFRYLIQEYHDGILLFNISEDKIWNYAVEDSAGLEAFYAQLKEKHLWEERFKGSIITCKDSITRDEADKFLAAETPFEEITDQLNAEENRITIETGAWEKGSNPVVDYYVWNEQIPANFNEALTFIRGDKILPEPKNLEDARGLYISDYQNYLEKNWIKELRKKYKITIDKKLLKTIESVE